MPTAIARLRRSLTVLRCLLIVGPALLSATALGAETTRPSTSPLHRLTVQLSWTDQTEFAGFYLAQRQKHFEAEGLDVVLKPISPNENPVDALHEGRADVAVSAFLGALKRRDAGPVTNIAQIFQTSPIVLICRQSLGVSTPRDIVGKRIGVAGGGDVDVLRAMLRALEPDGADVTIVPRDGTGKGLIDGEVACITGVTFNELLRVHNAGIPVTDLRIIHPESLGVADLGDGLYVRTERLASPEFRRHLTGLLRALARGWADAAERPSLAVAVTLERNPSLDVQFQYQALEAVLRMIPKENFGLLHPRQLDRLAAQLAASPAADSIPRDAWTHRIWNDWRNSDGAAAPLTPATRYALERFAQHPAFAWAVAIGAMMFGLGGALLGIEQGYNVWGRLFVALLPALGGGVLRDLLIGGPRLPLNLIADPTLPLALLAIVLLTSALIAYFPQWPHTALFGRVMMHAGALGSAVIATNGAIVALIAEVPWVWVPVFAAISCAGGGLLLDIVTSQPPRSFRGRLFEAEERGVLSAVVLLAALAGANRLEDGTVLVLIGVPMAVVVNVLVRFKRDALQAWYPAWLAARPGA